MPVGFWSIFRLALGTALCMELCHGIEGAQRRAIIQDLDSASPFVFGRPQIRDDDGPACGLDSSPQPSIRDPIS